jgi:putative ABC transport system ATP-binding protein
MTPDMKHNPILRLSDLRFRWPDGPVLLEIDEFELAAGERVFLRGPSGSGKSTLLGLIAGVHVPESGHVCLLGHDLGAMRASERDRLRGSELGYVFQQFNLVPYLTVLENVLLPLTFSVTRRVRTERLGPPGAQARALLSALGLEQQLADRTPRSLSVGQQQRVAVARALLGQPQLLICDEPTSALDTAARDGFLELLIRASEDTGAALLFVSHDASLARHFPRRLRLADGALTPA